MTLQLRANDDYADYDYKYVWDNRSSDAGNLTEGVDVTGDNISIANDTKIITGSGWINFPTMVMPGYDFEIEVHVTPVSFGLLCCSLKKSSNGQSIYTSKNLFLDSVNDATDHNEAYVLHIKYKDSDKKVTFTMDGDNAVYTIAMQLTGEDIYPSIYIGSATGASRFINILSFKAYYKKVPTTTTIENPKVTSIDKGEYYQYTINARYASGESISGAEVYITLSKYAQLEITPNNPTGTPITNDSTNKRYIITTDNNGEASFIVESKVDYFLPFSLQCHTKGTTRINASEDTPKTIFRFRVTPTIDTSGMDTSTFFGGYGDSQQIQLKGKKEDGIVGLPGKTINVYQGTELISSGTTGSDGYYWFDLNTDNSTNVNSKTISVVVQFPDDDPQFIGTSITKSITLKKVQPNIVPTIAPSAHNNYKFYYPEEVHVSWETEFNANTYAELDYVTERIGEINGTYTIPNFNNSIVDLPPTQFITQQGKTSDRITYHIKSVPTKNFGLAEIYVPQAIEYYRGSTTLTVTNDGYTGYINQELPVNVELKNWKGEGLGNKTIKYEVTIPGKEDKITGTVTTIANGKATIKVKSNVAEEGGTTGTFKICYEGDGYYEPSNEVTATATWIPKNKTNMTISSSKQEYYYPETFTITGRLTKKDNTGLSGKEVKVYRDNIVIKTLTTDTNGNISITEKPTPKVNPDSYSYRFEYAGDEAHDSAVSNDLPIKYRNRSYMTVSSNTELVDALDENSVKIILYDDADEPLTGVGVFVNMFLQKNDGTVLGIPYSNTKLITGNDGSVTINYNSKYGDSVANITIDYEGTSSIEASQLQTSYSWKYIATQIDIISNSGDTEVTLPGTVAAVLKTYKGTILPRFSIHKSLIATSYDPNSSESYVFVNTYEPTSVQGVTEITYTPQVGDIDGIFVFTFEGNESYSECTNFSNIKWEKILTQLSMNDLEIYSGRYTNLLTYTEDDWTIPSPGTNTSYNNVTGKLLTKDTNTSYKNVPSGTLTLNNTTLTVTNGNVTGRWTSENVGQNQTVTVKYGGSNLFKAVSTTLKYTVWARVPSRLTPETTIIYPEGYRYNVPFHVGAKLVAGSNIALSGQKLRIVVDGTTIGYPVTSNNGIGLVENYTPQVVKTVTVLAYFNEDDLIDKFLPTSLSYSLDIEKDYTLLTIIATPDKLYSGLEKSIVTMTLTDSLERPLKSQEILLLDYWNRLLETDDNGGTYITNILGKAVYQPEPWAGITVFKARYYGIWCYKSTSAKCDMEYIIDQTYDNLPVNNQGIATLTHNGAIPKGYYMVDEDYRDNGSPRRYANSGNNEHMAVLRHTRLIITGEQEVECGREYCIQAQLIDVATNKPLKGYPVTTKVNRTDNETRITDEEGIVRRYHVNDSPNDTDYVYFKFGTVDEYKGCEAEISVTTTPRVVALSFPYGHHIHGYSEVPYTVTALVQYWKEEYKRDEEDVLIKDGDGRCIPLDQGYVPVEGLYVELQNESNAPSESNESPVLASTHTDSDGIAYLTHRKHTIGTTPVEVVIPENDWYKRVDDKSSGMYDSRIYNNAVYAHTHERLQPVIECNRTQSAHYGIPCTIMGTLKAPVGYDQYSGQYNSSLVPIQGKTLRLKASKNIATTTTDGNGVGEFEQAYTPPQSGKRNFNIIYDHEEDEKYEKAIATVTVEADEGTPTIQVILSNDTVQAGNNVTVAARITYEGSVLTDARIDFIDTKKTSDGEGGLGKVYTDSKGYARLTFAPLVVGSHRIKAVFYGSRNKLEAVTESIVLTVTQA